MHGKIIVKYPIIKYSGEFLNGHFGTSHFVLYRIFVLRRSRVLYVDIEHLERS